MSKGKVERMDREKNEDNLKFWTPRDHSLAYKVVKGTVSNEEESS